MMEKRWTIKTYDKETSKQLQESLKINPTICHLLVQRGIETYEQAKNFFRSDINLLHNPFEMKDMQTAVDRIMEAIAHEEKILIYGDYDVDGTTSVAVVYMFFKSIYENIEFYIPHRFTEGYGVSKKGIDYAIENNIKLIITLDCGIKSATLIDYANQHNIDTIVTDHHLPGSDLPKAIAILNPKQTDCHYPYKELCGCGIGYKLISAFAMQNNLDADLVNENIDLLATAIAADIVPITGENRILAVLGLDKVNSNPSVALQALMQISDIKKKFTITDLVFIIAPRVNAAGRMDDARKAVELFIEKDLRKALDIAQILQTDNNERRDIDKSITTEALDFLFENENTINKKSTVVYQSHWHKGVVGIVASRLIEHHYKPTIVLTKSNGKLTGSARSIKGFNLFEGLNECAEYLENYGGHYFAAGLTLDESNLELFKNKFEEVVTARVPVEMFQPEIEIDAELSFDEINEHFLSILNQMAPHGPENMKPIFMSRNVKDCRNFSSVVKEKHIKLVVLQHSGKTMNGIGFNLADKISIVKSGKPFEILYHIEENIFNGNTSIQLKIIDIRQ